MNNFKKTLLATMITVSASSAMAVEVTDNLSMGLYGSAKYEEVKDTDNKAFLTTQNVYASYIFADHFEVMVDFNAQLNSFDINGSDLDSETYEVYQAYLSYQHDESSEIIVGRFANINPKGYNSLNDMDSLIGVDMGPIKALGNASYTHIDGMLFRYNEPLNGGEFSATFYGGQQQIILGEEQEYSGYKVAATFGFDIDGHNFLTGYEIGELEDDNDFDVDLEKVEYENYFITYQFETESFFTDNTYIVSNYEDGDFEDSKILDLKLGVKMLGFKPFIGFNQTEIGDEKIDTNVYGVRYEFKNMVGLTLQRSATDGVYDGSDVDYEEYRVMVSYSF